MTPATRDSPRSRAAAAALEALHVPAAPLAAEPRAPEEESGGPWWAGLLVETTPGAAPRVAARLLLDAGVQLCGGDGDRRLAVAVEGRGPVQAVAEALRRSDPEIAAVHAVRRFEEAR